MIEINKNNTLYMSFSCPNLPTLPGNLNDWTGAIYITNTYPTLTSSVSYDIVFSSDLTTMYCTISPLDMASLAIGAYKMVVQIINTVENIKIESVDTCLITETTPVITNEWTKIKVTLMKVDGTPAGVASQVLQNNPEGSPTLVSSWKGITVSFKPQNVSAINGNVIDLETKQVVTDSTGYAEILVLKGLNVTMTCPYLPSIIINTTDKDIIDISEVLP